MSTTKISSTQFWGNEPTILFNKDSIQQLWISPSMDFAQKLNAISRLVIILSILGFIFTAGFRFLIMGVVTLAVIYCIHAIRTQSNKESFENINARTEIKDPVTLATFMKSEFHKTTKKNPMGNVLLTDIGDTPDRKSAPPSFNAIVTEDINKATKQAVQTLNPGIKNTNKQLYGDLAQNFNFDESMRNFHSMPNTKVTNDQTAFAQYLYGDMPSCKEGDAFTCIQNNLRYIQM
jgi:hypothetical protein